MLVISRKENQSVVFPALGISADILRVAGSVVKVGIEAPADVRILRGELLTGDHADRPGPGGRAAAAVRSQSNHELRNRLNQATLALRLVDKQIAAGQTQAAQQTLDLALAALSHLERSSAPGTFDATAASAGPNDGLGQPDAAAPTGRRKRALLVEDDANERVLLASYLRSSGYDVDTVGDGQEALDYLANRKPDAVVMDLQMPRLNGGETVREIRSDYHFDDVKLYIVSGQEQSTTDVPCGDRGIQRWFQKPLDPDSLVGELRASLN